MGKRNLWSGLPASHVAQLSSIGLFILLSFSAAAATNNTEVATLKKLSLEELMNQDVTLVARTPEKLSESASAVQVITGEDIRRSTAVNLPEALRLAPNLQVAQAGANNWSISARGFNGAPLANNTLSDKLLVMIDGRSVYTPLFGGVFWDVQNVLMEDIDRIEIVSGPGGTLWGANAVNGVINVVTKSAKQSQGLFISGAGGSYWQDFGAVRYGGGNGSNVFYRVYGQRFDHKASPGNDGSSVNDSWDMTQGGFRIDFLASEHDTLTLQSDIYSGEQGSPAVENLDGQNILGRWTHVISEHSDFCVQMYYDRTYRNFPVASFSEALDIYDIDFQHRFPLGERQSILWGGGYRAMDDKANNSPILAFTPAERTLQLFSGFVQDEIVVVQDTLKITAGVKLEHNDYSGLEIQPNARLSFRMSEHQTLWGAVSRSMRSPSRFDTDLEIPTALIGDKGFESEKVIAYELGYRVRPMERLSLSLAAFFNQYTDLRSVNTNTSPTPTSLYVFGNNQEANTWGVEFAMNWQVVENWRLRGGYTYLGEEIWSAGPDVNPGSAAIEALDPKHQFTLQSILDLPGNFQLDLLGRYVDRLSAGNFSGTTFVPSYFDLDVRLAWSFRNWEFSVNGQHLIEHRHREFGEQSIPRAIYGKVTARF